MDFLSIQGGTIKEGKMSELKSWLDEHEGELREHAPPGSEYIGTYVAVFSSEKGAGDAFSVMRLDSYGAMDNIAAVTGRFSELLNEFVGFYEQSSTAPASSMLLKALTDATLWGDG